jgi:hypothetical protein
MINYERHLMIDKWAKTYCVMNMVYAMSEIVQFFLMENVCYYSNMAL